jgi:four helix bundle protein
MDYPAPLQQRIFEFAIAVIRFCRTLPRTDEAREVASRLRRASNGAAANYRASRRARSRAEWFAKMGIALEEAECRELIAIIAKSLATRQNDRSLDPQITKNRNRSS